MQLRFLGTGTSSGIPVLGCVCDVCLSKDPRDRRYRCAALLSIGDKRILIDAGPEIRLALIEAQTRYLNAILITHEHFDHVAGLDDFRPFSWHRPLDIYALPRTFEAIKRQLPYLFDDTPLQVGGGLTQFLLHAVEPLHSFTCAGLDILPIAVMHGRLPIVGWKIGRLAYLTDVKVLPQESIDAVKGVDTLVISCLRKTPHSTHIGLEEALNLIKQIKPRVAYFIHMNHEVKHAVWEKELPEGVFLAYDGLEITVPDN
ncbi:MAG: MBL fold metallo-hydrolase [Brevinema sp.]